MANIGIIRCEKNEQRCPLTNCIKSLRGTQQAFADYEDGELIGVFTCHCPGDNVANLGKILQNKGAEAIHMCTCTFASKDDGGWVMGDGFCENIDELMQQLADAVDVPCVKGTAHLPEGYTQQVFRKTG